MNYEKVQTDHPELLIAEVWARFAAAAVEDYRYDGGGMKESPSIAGEAASIADALTAEFKKRFFWV